jgi:hypothetical protein
MPDRSRCRLGLVRHRVGDDTDNVSIKPEHGNGKAYTLRRLAKDHPELFEQVKTGQLSANQAAIQAGFRKVKTPAEQVRALWQKLTDEERSELLYWMTAEAPSGHGLFPLGLFVAHHCPESLEPARPELTDSLMTDAGH